MTTDPPDPAPGKPATPPAVPATPPVMPSPAAPLAYLPSIALPQHVGPPTPDERTTGMLIHLLAILTGWLGPLILWLVRKDSSLFIHHHGKEALNFQLTYILISVCCMAVVIVTAGFGALLVIPFLLVMVILALIFEIQACIAANNGQWYHYPVCIRFIR